MKTLMPSQPVSQPVSTPSVRALHVAPEQFGSAPNASLQGTGLSAVSDFGAAAYTPIPTLPTITAVRKDDARVPPRGRPL